MCFGCLCLEGLGEVGIAAAAEQFCALSTRAGLILRSLLEQLISKSLAVIQLTD